MKNLKPGTLLRNTANESFPDASSGRMIHLSKKTKSDILVLLGVELSDDPDNSETDDFDNEYIWTIMHPKHGLLYWTDTQQTFAECFDIIAQNDNE
jgi:hypothetical protein